MKFICAFIVSILLTAIDGNEDICKENNNTIEIKIAFRFDKYTVFITNTHKVYRIKNFVLKDKDFSYEEIVNITKSWKYNKNNRTEKYTFPMDYTRNGTTRRLIHIMKEESETLWQLFSYSALHSPDLTQVTEEDRVSMLIYKYKPGEDPLNLNTLFAKFPSDKIYDNILTIGGFPLNQPSLPNRFFVYYLEKPTKQMIKEGKTETNFKRHIIVGKPAVYENDTETNWQHDLNSGKCFSTFPVIRASFPLTDYSKSGNQYVFNVMEFSDKQYFVKSVKLTANKVDEDMKLIKKGLIGEIFKCKVMPETDQDVTMKTPYRKSTALKVLIVIFGILGVIAAILVFIVAYNLYYGTDANHDNLESGSPPPPPPPPRAEHPPAEGPELTGPESRLI